MLHSDRIRIATMTCPLVHAQHPTSEDMFGVDGSDIWAMTLSSSRYPSPPRVTCDN